MEDHHVTTLWETVCIIIYLHVHVIIHVHVCQQGNEDVLHSSMELPSLLNEAFSLTFQIEVKNSIIDHNMKYNNHCSTYTVHIQQQ